MIYYVRAKALIQRSQTVREGEIIGKDFNIHNTLRVVAFVRVRGEIFKKYLTECALSHPQTNQQPMGNKNVLSVIVNYKYWSLPYCSLLIVPNGLPLTITKPLTLCVSVFK